MPEWIPGDLDEILPLEPKKISYEKRGHPPDVDVWQLCPHTMAQADCFYTYLKVYARLRKGAREIDPVHMRNIGKRSSIDDQVHSLSEVRSDRPSVRRDLPSVGLDMPSVERGLSTVKPDQITINCPNSMESVDCLYRTVLFAQNILRVYKNRKS
ncbi:hypothetical protein LOTGIDRAFT_172068 [Lottia gigantea]|uniref:Uncharacterized protein n=1 Tax=Lottia gigantea TaxID=225164 RepID=V4CJP5_LOTGI|nr:hypothetical protein LOTGIDRAFT_172068 [Lottia gigantea]ESP02410.1 hypothetical protein LOTGIDRAFT_172068 [Lottia gigantea]